MKVIYTKQYLGFAQYINHIDIVIIVNNIKFTTEY